MPKAPGGAPPSPPKAGGAGAAGAPPKGPKELGDDTSACRIWADSIRREMQAAGSRKPGTFSVNVATLKPISSAVGAVDKSIGATAASRAAAEETKQELVRLLQAAKLPPQAKGATPATCSQEVGWYWQEGEKPPFKAVHACSEEVKYAQRYYDTFHCGPFERKAGGEGGAKAAPGGGSPTKGGKAGGAKA